MGFLDNSGDIILDAVLTDVGRKRLAEGEFRIRKFALGDDEIDYSLYNANHPSGSAYYDLEILQTPVMEAATRQASSIQYGLLSLTRNDLVYLPVLALNELVGVDAVSKFNNVVLLAANKKTYDTLSNDANVGFNKVLSSDTLTPKAKVIIESGIKSNDRQPTRENRQSIIVDNNLLDLQYNVRFDNRFISGLISLQRGANQKFSNNTDGKRNVNLTSFIRKAPTNAIDFIDSYSLAVADGVENLVLQYDTATSDPTGTNLSALEGPRGGAVAMTFAVSSEINAQGISSPKYYTLYGSTGVVGTTLGFASSETFDFIDSVIYVQGVTTGANLQIPVRIIRQQA